MNDAQQNQFPRTDHDILVTLSANFVSFTKQYALDVKELKDGTKLTLDDHETRIRKLEEIVHDDKTTRKAQLRVASLTGAIVTFVLGTAATVLGILSGFIHTN